MSPKDTLFFAEMYSLVKKMEETIDEFDMKERVLASIIRRGLGPRCNRIRSDRSGDEDHVQLQPARQVLNCKP